MRALAPERLELINALVAETDLRGLTAGLLEKDEHLTDALRAMFAKPFEDASLVLCGGTSLSKAHGLIERMSEDVDLKIVLSPNTLTASRPQMRELLGALRASVSEVLKGIGLVEVKARARALNENRYFCSEWSYAGRYESVVGLRANLQIELTTRTPVRDTLDCRIGSLADRLAGREDRLFSVTCVSVEETVAEKILSFLRRYAQHRAGLLPQVWDTNLVRHIYDVHCVRIGRPEAFAGAAEAFPKLVAMDQKEFGGQFPDFAAGALPVLAGALKQTAMDGKTRDEYERNLLPLVYGDVLTPFPLAFQSFECIASELLATLATSPRAAP